jgi:hypothetical protein
LRGSVLKAANVVTDPLAGPSIHIEMLYRRSTRCLLYRRQSSRTLRALLGYFQGSSRCDDVIKIAAKHSALILRKSRIDFLFGSRLLMHWGMLLLMLWLALVFERRRR